MAAVVSRLFMAIVSIYIFYCFFSLYYPKMLKFLFTKSYKSVAYCIWRAKHKKDLWVKKRDRLSIKISKLSELHTLLWYMTN